MCQAWVRYEVKYLPVQSPKSKKIVRHTERILSLFLVAEDETPREYADRIQRLNCFPILITLLSPFKQSLMASNSGWNCVNRSYSDKKHFEDKIKEGCISEEVVHSIQADRLSEKESKKSK